MVTFKIRNFMSEVYGIQVSIRLKWVLLWHPRSAVLATRLPSALFVYNYGIWYWYAFTKTFYENIFFRNIIISAWILRELRNVSLINSKVQACPLIWWLNEVHLVGLAVHDNGNLRGYSSIITGQNNVNIRLFAVSDFKRINIGTLAIASYIVSRIVVCFYW